MSMLSIPVLVASIYEDLLRLRTAYAYMVQNAPTEESRRLIDMNLNTVKYTLEQLEHLHTMLAPQQMLPTQTPLDVPIFTNFMDAARYAFMTETQLIRKARELHSVIEVCHRLTVFNIIVDHQLNAMRLLYLDLS